MRVPVSSEPDFGLGIAFALNQPMNSTLAEIVDQADVTTATNINVSADGLHDLDADAIGGAVSERFGRHQFECGTHRARSGTKCSTRRLPASVGAPTLVVNRRFGYQLESHGDDRRIQRFGSLG